MVAEATFLATIRERPEEAGPKLVYADWLEERGECDKAELLRLEVELARPCEYVFNRTSCSQAHQWMREVRERRKKAKLDERPESTMVLCDRCRRRPAIEERVKELKKKLARNRKAPEGATR